MTEARNDIAKAQQRELEHTSISPRTARVFSVAFLVVIFSVPVLQFMMGTERHTHSLIRPMQQGIPLAMKGEWSAAWHAVAPMLRRDFYLDYEDAQMQASLPRNALRPHLQGILSAMGGFGNDKVSLGKDGWLFYQPGLRYVYGPGFLGTQPGLRPNEKPNRPLTQHDPREAILQLHNDCARLGIHLIVFPVPDKAMIQPWSLSSAYDEYETMPPLNNVDYAAFTSSLREAGVDIFDVLPEEIGKDGIRYLQGDTHWTPKWMEQNAATLAERLHGLNLLSPAPEDAIYHHKEDSISCEGDLVEMLMLARQQRQFPAQKISLNQVMDMQSGAPFQSQRDAEVLLLGDSFTNIYSDPALGWGAHAGLGAQLAYAMNRPIDILALNGGGAFGVRQALAKPQHLARLAHKKVLIYQFSMRDLLEGDWRPVPLPETVAPLSAPKEAVMEVVARVQKTSTLPKPNESPYKDCLSCISLTVEGVLTGEYEDNTLLALFQVMENRRLLPPAELIPGDRLWLELIPGTQMPEKFLNMQLSDSTEDYTHLPFFALSFRKLASDEFPAPAVLATPTEKPSIQSKQPASPPTIPFRRDPDVAHARKQAIEKAQRLIVEELLRHGNGNWDNWFTATEPARDALRKRLNKLRPASKLIENKSPSYSTLLPSLTMPPQYQPVPKPYLQYMNSYRTLPAYREKEQAFETITLAAKWLEGRGIDVIFVHAPLKVELYPERFVDTAEDSTHLAPHVRALLLDLLAHDVEVLDSFALLQPLKYVKENRGLYYPVDNHWNQHATQHLAQALRQRLLRYPVVQAAVHDTSLFELIVDEKRFESTFYTLLSEAQHVQVEDYLTDKRVSVQALGDTPVFRDDAPIGVAGDSFGYWSGAAAKGGLNAFLAHRLNMPIANLTRAGGATHFLGELYRNPQRYPNLKTIVWVVNSSWLGRNYIDLPAVILEDLDLPATLAGAEGDASLMPMALSNASAPLDAGAFDSILHAQARRNAIAASRKEIQQEVEAWGHGNWNRWLKDTAPFRDTLNKTIASLPVHNPEATLNNESRGKMLPTLEAPLLFECRPTLYLDYIFEIDRKKNIRQWLKEYEKVIASITAASRMLSDQDIDLILLPVPKMSEVYANHLSRETLPGHIAAPHIRFFLDALLANDVEVIDLLPLYQRQVETGDALLYHPADPHWLQPAQEIAARQVTERLQRYACLQEAAAAPKLYERHKESLSLQGGGFDGLTPVQQDALQPYLTASIDLVSPLTKVPILKNTSPILVIGDSYAHYSPVKDGDFVSLLAEQLNSPVTRYSSGGQITEAFIRFSREPEYLADRKTVIWVISMPSLFNLKRWKMPAPILEQYASSHSPVK